MVYFVNLYILIVTSLYFIWVTDQFPFILSGASHTVSEYLLGEALYSQQNKDVELIVAQIMSSLLQNSDLN